MLIEQLNLVKELNLPVVFHCRMAHQDLIQFLKENDRPEKALVHGFVENLNIEGINFEENIKKTPLDKILIETDCPYLTPPQVASHNKPLYVKYVAEKIAKIKNLSYEEIIKITTENAVRFFNFLGIVR